MAGTCDSAELLYDAPACMAAHVIPTIAPGRATRVHRPGRSVALLHRPAAVARALLLVLFSTFVVTGCDDSTTEPVPVLTTVTVALSASSISAGATTTATATGTDQNGEPIATGTVSWATGSASVATVDANGTVTGVAAGTTQIIATAGGVVGQQTITVTAQPPQLTTLVVTLPLSPIVQGQTITATVEGLDQHGTPIATGPVTWSTGSVSIATVSTAGVVTGVAPGATPVIATAGGRTAQNVLTVAAPPAVRINEIESNGGTPGDWVELFNPTTSAVDISGWALKDDDDTRPFRFAAGTTIPAGGYLVVEEATFNYGLGAADAARLYNQFGVLVDSHAWTAHAISTYGRCPNGTGAFVEMPSTKGAPNDCRPSIRINEVESNGGTPGDWVELINIGTTAVDVSGFIIKDDDDSRTSALPAGTILAPGAFYVIEETTMGFGLGAADAARLYTTDGVLVDSYAWTAHAPSTYGRCPDGTGAFVPTTSTKGAPNQCAPTGPSGAPWPGLGDVQTVDGMNVFGTNMSGLAYEGASGGSPAVLWAAKNGPGTLYRLIASGDLWIPDPANNWGAGKTLRYPDSLGDVDAEGVTFAGGTSAGGMYVAAERNNAASGVSRNSVLRYDVSQTWTTLRATHEWNLTADLPVTGANLGAEAIAWIPDSVLVNRQFFDESKGAAYAPADYPDHGTGIFFVALEANGVVYAYALNHANSTFTRIATITTGYPGVMDLEYDPSTHYLWATCDDGCNNTFGVLEIDTGAGSPTRGRFVGPRSFARPAGLGNFNNEGFAITPSSECVGGVKPVFWADDNQTGGHALRRGSITCGPIPAPAMMSRRR